MTIIVGQTYQHVPTGLPCTITDVSRVSGRAMGTLSDGRPVHDIATHDLLDLPAPAPAAAPSAPEPVASGPDEDDDDEDEGDDIKPPGLLTPRQFGRRLRGDRP